MSRKLLGALGGLGLSSATLLFGAEARAYDTLAEACQSDPWFCQTGAIAFARTDALPIEWSFDTGWVPQGSPLQVHLWAYVHANTTVSLAGDLETSWFEALELRTPGKKGGGNLGFHYGVDIGAQAMISVSVAGQSYSWTGDIPYFPQFDFQVEASDGFDAWGWDPGHSVQAITQPQKLFQVGIGDIVGGSIPGIDGGLELDVAMELRATYVTERVVIETTDGQPVEGGEITSDPDHSTTPYKGGPSIELDVHPEGYVDYDGVLHLIPAFYVEILGQNWNIPIVDIPIPFPITQVDWIFDPVRVHVPLPDLVLAVPVVELGEVEVGQKMLKTFPVLNAGEAPLTVSMASSDPELFEVFTTSFDVPPFVDAQGVVRFVPKKPGEFTATVFVGSNDPSDPVQEVLLHGTAVGVELEEPVTGPAPSITEDGGCACRAGAGAPRASAGLWAMALLGGAGALRRRRRR